MKSDLHRILQQEVIFMDNGRTIPKNKALQVTKARVLSALFCKIISFGLTFMTLDQNAVSSIIDVDRFPPAT